MEIYSIRSSHNLQFGNNQKGNSQPEVSAQPQKHSKVSFQINEQEAPNPDFAAISMAEIREIAQKSFDQGQIDHDTFSTLYQGLPMQAIDTSGQIIDLSEVTDTTPFNFLDFYQSQLQIASSIGDPRTAEILQSVVSFLNSPGQP